MRKGRAAYNELLEVIGQLAMKAKSRMRRLLDEIEEPLEHLHDAIALDVGLGNAHENLL